MDGKKVVIALFALVILVGIVTFTLYLLTRQIEDDAEFQSPNAIEIRVEADSSILS